MTEGDARVHRALSTGSRLRLYQALRRAGRPLAAQELAEEVELHLSTVRAHLDVLVDAGLVESRHEPRSTPGRPRVLYTACPNGPAALLAPAGGDGAGAGGDGAGAGGYRLLAEVLVGHLAGTADDPSGQARAAGQVWGRYLMDRPPPFVEPSRDDARAKVVELFATLGFEPEFDGDGDRILLRRCPFLDMAQRHPDVVCSLHLGLVQGALETLGAPLDVQELDPLVEPSLCVLHLDGDVDRLT